MECLFCEIVNREKDAYIIAENEKVLAVLDIYPASDGHTLLISKSHFASISEVDEES
jgi:histidine triad (HIT) family protein